MKHVMLAVLVWVVATPCWAGFDEGKAAYDRGDYATALRESLPLAQQGDAPSQFLLGALYLRGEGVPKDYAETNFIGLLLLPRFRASLPDTFRSHFAMST